MHAIMMNQTFALFATGLSATPQQSSKQRAPSNLMNAAGSLGILQSVVWLLTANGGCMAKVLVHNNKAQQRLRSDGSNRLDAR